MEHQISKRCYHKYNLGTPLIYFHNKHYVLEINEMLHLIVSDDTTCKGELAADTESIAYCSMKVNCRLIHTLGHIF